MNALVSQTLRAIPRYSSPRACRFIAGRRFALPTRAFHLSAPFKSSDNDPSNSPNPAWSPVQDTAGIPIVNEEAPEIEDISEIRGYASGISPDSAAPEDTPPADSSKRARENGHYGSRSKRSTRNTTRPREPVKVEMPSLFLERNVELYEDTYGDCHQSHTQNASEIVSNGLRTLHIRPSAANSTPNTAELTDSATMLPDMVRVPPDEDAYEIDENIFRELTAMVAAGLRLAPSQTADIYPASKPHIVLQSPKDGGILFLDTVVQTLALHQGAHVIKIDADDIAELGETLSEVGKYPITASSLRSLGYDTHAIISRQEQQEKDEDEASEEPFEDSEDDDHGQGRPRQPSFSFNTPKNTPVPVIHVSASIPKLVDLLNSGQFGTSIPVGNIQLPRRPAPNPKDNDGDEVLEAFLDAAQAKQRILSMTNKCNDAEGVSEPPIVEASEDPQRDGLLRRVSTQERRDLIILVRDYLELNSTSAGGPILSRLHRLVSNRRKNGEKILIVGTSSSEDLIPSLSRSGFRAMQTEPGHGPYRAIIVPCRSPSAESIFADDEKSRIFQINMRHLQQMIGRIASKPTQVETIVSQRLVCLDSAEVFASGMDESVWTIERIHRTTMMILGSLGEGDQLTECHFSQALGSISASDNAKFEWIFTEKELAKAVVNAPLLDSKRDLDERLKKLRRSCNAHEKKLLSGVIDAAGIHTTFADVKAPASTIEALKTLTSLSLIRPDAFTYGVLATDKIPGLLLYGPPGTGKTLLAKAVAKESGATVLEVSGSDVYDMYVGEGEKNVKAIFTLAKKLTPCVVFIDEADAIFGSRNNSHNRTSHRELINQFLREWDGMNDLSAFIMVATNRPFDLDDAVLRRLPRRLLIDLPTEKDREAILRIHLREEVLDPSVSLSTLASKTPFYSGSDLKNLSVAAALACVRDEIDAASTHAGVEPYQPPAKRTLTSRHFDKAMDEISASVSEDMSSLAAIRKFDEKFGDRKGRKKKVGGYGFGMGREKDEGKDTVRVRDEM
jgi:SpoVK/Ycf46/Vps4 family AAA+-type ATPase